MTCLPSRDKFIDTKLQFCVEHVATTRSDFAHQRANLLSTFGSIHIQKATFQSFILKPHYRNTLFQPFLIALLRPSKNQMRTLKISRPSGSEAFVIIIAKRIFFSFSLLELKFSK